MLFEGRRRQGMDVMFMCLRSGRARSKWGKLKESDKTVELLETWLGLTA